MLLFSQSAAAQTQVGDTEVVYSYVLDTPTRSAINASITAAGDEVWIAVESINDGLDAISLDLHYFNGTGWSDKRLTTDALDISVESFAMYPSITTSYNGYYDTYVYTTGKQNLSPSGTQPHLTAFRQDRDNMGAAASETDMVASPGTNVRHGRPHQLFDPAWTDAMYTCFTRRNMNQADPDDDLLRKGKSDSESWASVSADTLSDEEDEIEDHCEQGVDDDGHLWTVFHWDGTGDDRIWVNDSEFDVSTGTWTNNANLLLGWGSTGWTDADFPSFASATPVYGSDVRMLVARRVPTLTNTFVWWRCVGGATDCDQTGDWTVGTFNPPSNAADIRAPMVVMEHLFGHAFAFWEYAGSLDGEIGIAKWCDGDTAWTEVGIIQHATNYANVDYAWGELPGSSVPVLAASFSDDLTLHAVFLATPGSFADARNDVLHWSIDIESLCP